MRRSGENRFLRPDAQEKSKKKQHQNNSPVRKFDKKNMYGPKYTPKKLVRQMRNGQICVLRRVHI